MCHTTFDYNYTLEKYQDFALNCRKFFPEKTIDFLFIQYSDNSSIINNYASDGIYIYTIPNHPQKKDNLNNFLIWSNMDVLKLCIAKHFYSISQNEFLLKKDKSNNSKIKYYFWGLPMFKKKIKRNKTKYYILGIPVWVTKIKENTCRGYLFGIIPLLTRIEK